MVATQFETVSKKSKPGTMSAIDGSSWQMTRKVALPSINMNNPHNMWIDRDQNVIYVTQWFDKKLTVYDRQTGALIRNVSVGESPAHVMTLTNNDRIHVTNNGDTRKIWDKYCMQLQYCLPICYASALFYKPSLFSFS